MSLRPTERLTRSLDLISEQLLRLEADATKYGSPEPGGYPAALGLLLGSVRGRLELMDHFLTAAHAAAQDVWNPCTHDNTRCPWCDEAAEQRAQEVAP